MGKFKRRLVEFFFIHVQNCVGCWLEFHFTVQAQLRGLVVLIKLFCCCGL